MDIESHYDHLEDLNHQIGKLGSETVIFLTLTDWTIIRDKLWSIINDGQSTT